MIRYCIWWVWMIRYCISKCRWASKVRWVSQTQWGRTWFPRCWCLPGRSRGIFGVGEFYQILEDVVCTRVSGFVPVLVAGIELVKFQVFESAIRISVVCSRAIFVVDWVALEPFFKSHCAHDVVVRHRVEGVESVLDSFLGRETHLEGVADSSAGVAVIVKNFVVFESPGFDDAGVGVVRFGDIVLFLLSVEEENLSYFQSTRL